MMKYCNPLLLTVCCLGLARALGIDPATLQDVSAERASEQPVVVGAEGWLYLPAELRHISAGQFWGADAAAVSQARKPEHADPLPAILDFKRQLDAMGIALILVPVPAKAMVYPEYLIGVEVDEEPLPRLDPFHQQFYDVLEENGVSVIDLLPEFLERRKEEQLFCQTDTHWSGVATVIAAEKIAEWLNEKGIQGTHPVSSTVETKLIEVRGDLVRMQNDPAADGEILTLRVVESDDGEPVVDPSSPVLLLGDSHTLVFHSGGDMLASGAGLADQLANEWGYEVDLIGVRGSGATPARINLLRKARSQEGYLQNKKAVVWCFTVREFTESSGWMLVPIGS